MMNPNPCPVTFDEKMNAWKVTFYYRDKKRVLGYFVDEEPAWDMWKACAKSVYQPK